MVVVWVPLLAAAIGAVFGLSSAALTPVLASRNEHREWLRDRRRQVCEAYYTVLVEANTAATLIGQSISGDGPPVDAEQVRHGTQQRSIFDRMWDARARMIIYVSPPLRDYTSELDVMFIFATRGSSTSTEVDAAGVDLERATDAVLKLIRAELKVD